MVKLGLEMEFFQLFSAESTVSSVRILQAVWVLFFQGTQTDSVKIRWAATATRASASGISQVMECWFQAGEIRQGSPGTAHR